MLGLTEIMLIIVLLFLIIIYFTKKIDEPEAIVVPEQVIFKADIVTLRLFVNDMLKTIRPISSDLVPNYYILNKQFGEMILPYETTKIASLVDIKINGVPFVQCTMEQIYNKYNTNVLAKKCYDVFVMHGIQNMPLNTINLAEEILNPITKVFHKYNASEHIGTIKNATLKDIKNGIAIAFMLDNKNICNIANNKIINNTDWLHKTINNLTGYDLIAVQGYIIQFIKLSSVYKFCDTQNNEVKYVNNKMVIGKKVKITKKSRVVHLKSPS